MKKLKHVTDQREKCHCCDHKLKKGHKYIEFTYPNYWNPGTIRVCDVCIYRLNKELDEDHMEKRIEEMALEAL